MINRLFSHLVCLTVLFSSSAVTFADWAVISEHWYGVTIDGAKSGWASKILEEDDQFYRTSETQNMTLSRAGIELEIKVNSVFVETKSGVPVSVTNIQEAMGQTSETVWLFKPDKIIMTSKAGGKPITKTVPMPGHDWLTPQDIKRLFVEKMTLGDLMITFTTLTPELGAKPVTVVMKRLDTQEQDVLGISKPVSKWEVSNDLMPITATEFYTANGVSVGSVMNAGFGNIVNTLMSKHEALSPLNEIPELMVSMFVEPNQSIPDDPSLKRIAMKVRSKDGTAITLPSVGAQQATVLEDGSVLLNIDIASPVDATDLELSNDEYLAATAICDGSDEAVIAVATSTLKSLSENASSREKAFALRDKVYEYIDNKGLSTAFASASQTARDRKGDCSEHGVLLCGVLRAAGIPSRGVMGMVYVPNLGAPNGVFGWHMWSQALIDGQWIDLDATLKTPYSVGHIATVTSSLSDEGLQGEMAGILNTIGNLEIEILEIGSHAK